MRKKLLISFGLFGLFLLWTALVCFIDVKPVGPKGSKVGFSELNNFIHNLTGVNMTLYVITDWLGLVPIAVCLYFAFIGLIQLIKRKSLLKVDIRILILGLFYIIVFGLYVLFEYIPINYRPVLIEGILEVSYPSSTTLLVLCVMLTALINLKYYIKNLKIRKIISIMIFFFIVFMVICRLLSGVHWFTDIVGSILISASLVTFYKNIIKKIKNT